MINIEIILRYYAMMCLIGSPFSVIMIIVLYKKTTVIQRLNKWFDKVLGVEKSDSKKTDKKESDTKNQEANSQVPPAEEQNKMAGVTAFAIIVGDKYFCKLNSQNAAIVGNGVVFELKWSSKNQFIGRVLPENGENIFLAERCGETSITCTQKDNDYDSGAEIYRITVLPHNPDWFAEKTFHWVLVNSPEANLTELLERRKILNVEANKNLTVYSGAEPFEKQLILQTDKYNGVLRAVYFLKLDSKELQSLVFNEMSERFDEIKVKGDIRFWVHRIEDESSNKVDTYAFFKKSVTGDYILAFGHAWREEGEVEEFVLNINMAERFFKDCLPNEPVTDIDAAESLEEAIKLQEEKRNNSKEKVIINSDESPKEEYSSEQKKDEDKSSSGNNNNESEPEKTSSGSLIPGKDDIPEIEDVPEPTEQGAEETKTENAEPEGENFEDVDAEAVEKSFEDFDDM